MMETNRNLFNLCNKFKLGHKYAKKKRDNMRFKFKNLNKIFLTDFI